MNFSGKSSEAKQEFNLVVNGKKQKIKADGDIPHTYMQIACNVIFTQISANAGLKKYGQPAVAAMIK